MISAGCIVNNLLDEIVKSKSYINLKGVSTYREVLQELLSISVNEESKEVHFTFP